MPVRPTRASPFQITAASRQRWSEELAGHHGIETVKSEVEKCGHSSRQHPGGPTFALQHGQPVYHQRRRLLADLALPLASPPRLGRRHAGRVRLPRRRHVAPALEDLPPLEMGIPVVGVELGRRPRQQPQRLVQLARLACSMRQRVRQERIGRRLGQQLPELFGRLGDMLRATTTRRHVKISERVERGLFTASPFTSPRLRWTDAPVAGQRLVLDAQRRARRPRWSPCPRSRLIPSASPGPRPPPAGVTLVRDPYGVRQRRVAQRHRAGPADGTGHVRHAVMDHAVDVVGRVLVAWSAGSFRSTRPGRWRRRRSPSAVFIVARILPRASGGPSRRGSAPHRPPGRPWPGGRARCGGR